MAKIRPLIAGNWKMHLSGAEAQALAKATAEAAAQYPAVDVAIAPPSIWLERVSAAVAGTSVGVLGQNAAEEKQGAFTGETSFPMLLDVGAQGALLGHSERRHVFGESNESIAKRAKLGVELGALIVLCVGETLDQRRAETTFQVVGEQLQIALPLIPADKLVVAYEPVWAIGTGETATPDQAREVHAEIRRQLVAFYGEAGAGIRILYGGSVKPDNAAELMGQPDVNGVLVGGASLKAGDFAAIIAAGAR